MAALEGTWKEEEAVRLVRRARDWRRLSGVVMPCGQAVGAAGPSGGRRGRSLAGKRRPSGLPRSACPMTTGGGGAKRLGWRAAAR